MSRAAVAILAAGVALAACSQSETRSWPQGQPFPQTRADLYRQYGPPDAIRVEGDNRWLRYDRAKAKGMTLGARYYGLGLALSRSQSQADRLWIRVAPDERITAVQPAVASDTLGYRLWPFGD